MEIFEYKFLDVGCKDGSSFFIAKNFGFDPDQGLGIDISEKNIKGLTDAGYNGMVACATDIPFADNSFELVIFSHVLEHLPDEKSGRKALLECLRVSSKHVFLALPFFDEDDYLNSLGFKTFYSDWRGHTNMVHLSKILNDYLIGYEYDIKMVKKITDSSFSEIIPITADIDSFDYDPEKHGPKEIVSFDRDIWREYHMVISKR